MILTQRGIVTQKMHKIKGEITIEGIGVLEVWREEKV